MKKPTEIYLDFEIDKLTNSIENAISGEVFETKSTSIVINFNKMDDKDFVFINKTLSEKEDKEFSAFLKKRKSGIRKKALIGKPKPDKTMRVS